MIWFCKRAEIDDGRWNDCVTASYNSSLYGFTWYMDAVANQWSGLIIDDYKAVMPIAEGERYFLRYCYQPWFTQRCDIFSINELSENIIDDIFCALKKRYFFGNHAISNSKLSIKTNNYIIKSNQFLPLKQSNNQIHNNFRRNTNRALQKAEHANFTIHSNTETELFINFIQQHLPDVIPAKQLPIVKNLTNTLLNKKSGALYWVSDAHNNLHAAALCGWHDSRFYFMICTSSPFGHKNGAMSFLVKHLIDNASHKYKIFDFCGSSLPGVAHFNAGFGAITEQYSVLKIKALGLL